LIIITILYGKSSYPSSPPLLLLKATIATNYTFAPLPIFFVLNRTTALDNIESSTEIEEETRNYMGLNYIPALKKNIDAMEQIGKPFVQRFKRHGVRSEIYHLSRNSNSSSSSKTSEQETVAAPERLESIAKTISIGDDVEIWVLLQFYRDQAHADEVHSNMMQDESVG
jgi:MinD-like ATPase involved in chromosome partitioning or flagellar assembly